MTLDSRPMRYALFFAATLLVLLAAYAPSMQGEFLASDFRTIVHNMQLVGLRGLRSIWLLPPSGEFAPMDQYQPLTYSLWWVERRVFGLDPRWYQATSVVLHAVSSLLVWRLLSRVGVRGAGVAAAIFALHPLHVESLAWVYEQKNPLSGVTFFLSLHAYLNWKHERLPSWYAAALVLFGLSLLTKASVVVLPAVLLLHTWHEREPLNVRSLLPLLPFFALGAGMAVLTIWYEGSITGASGHLFSAGFLERFGRAGWVTGFNVGKVLLPIDLAFLYPRWTFNTSSAVAYLPNLAIVVVLLGLWLRRESWGRPALLGVGWYLFLLFPVAGFFDIYYHQFSLVADHFQYLPSLGLIALGVHGITIAAERVGLVSPSTRPSAAALALSFVVVGLYFGATWQRSHVFASEGMLFRDAADKYPASWLAFQKHAEFTLKRISRGEDVSKAERIRSIRDLKHAALSQPDEPQIHDSLGVIYQIDGDLDASRRHLERAIQLDWNNAGFHWNLALLYDRIGEAGLAVAEYEFVSKAQPKSIDKEFEHARALVRAERFNQAVTALDHVVTRTQRRAAQVPKIAELQRRALQLRKQVKSRVDARLARTFASTSASNDAPWSVLFVTVDTLRPDYLSANGYDRPTSPALDAFLAESVYFEQALTPIPRTTPALASLMTGAYPHATGVRSLASRLPDEMMTLAEAFQAEGHQTLAVVTNMMLASVRGLDSGFDTYDAAPDQRDAKRTTNAALQHLRLTDPTRPLFAWIHYIDPHVPYHPTIGDAAKFDPGYRGRFAENFGRQPGALEPSDLFREFPEGITKAKVTHRNPLTKEENHHIQRLYAGDISRVDREVDRLVSFVRSKHPRTIIVFTADHGESLGEHDFYFDHGDYTYNAASRVPLAFALPNDHPLHTAGRREGWVSLVDVAPTLFELMGKSAPPEMAALFEGRSLVPSLRGEVQAPKPVFIESGTSYFPKLVRRLQQNSIAGRFRAVVLDDWKLIFAPMLPEKEAYELYDLSSDPNETVNQYRSDHPRFAALKSALDGWMNAATPETETTAPLSERDREALRKLGYIE